MKKKIASQWVFITEERKKKFDGFAWFTLWSLYSWATGGFMVTRRPWRAYGEHSSFCVWFVHIFLSYSFLDIFESLVLKWNVEILALFQKKSCLLASSYKIFCINSSKMGKRTPKRRFIGNVHLWIKILIITGMWWIKSN